MSIKSRLRKRLNEFLEAFCEEAAKGLIKLVIDAMITINMRVAELQAMKEVEERRQMCKCCRCKKW